MSGDYRENGGYPSFSRVNNGYNNVGLGGMLHKRFMDPSWIDGSSDKVHYENASDDTWRVSDPDKWKKLASFTAGLKQPNLSPGGSSPMARASGALGGMF